MALVVCHDCQKQISDTASVCVNCGRPMREPQTSYTEKMSKIQYDLTFIWIVVLTLILLGAGGVWLYNRLVGN